MGSDKIDQQTIGFMGPTGAFESDQSRSIGMRIYKHDGYWSIERLRNGEVVDVYAGAPDVADALNHIGHWLRTV